MIVCGNCGHRNDESDAFCGSCGQFLEWVGERVEGEPAPEDVVEPEAPAAESGGLLDRVRHAVGMGETGESPAPAAGEEPEGLGAPNEPVVDEPGRAIEPGPVPTVEEAIAVPSVPETVSAPVPEPEPRVTTESVAIAEPEAVPEPEPEPEPEPVAIAEPEAGPEPEPEPGQVVIAEPEAEAEPEPEPGQVVIAEPEAEAEPVVIAEPEAEAEPEPEPGQVVIAEPEAEAEPVAIAEPEAEAPKPPAAPEAPRPVEPEAVAVSEPSRPLEPAAIAEPEVTAEPQPAVTEADGEPALAPLGSRPESAPSAEPEPPAAAEPPAATAAEPVAEPEPIAESEPVAEPPAAAEPPAPEPPPEPKARRGGPSRAAAISFTSPDELEPAPSSPYPPPASPASSPEPGGPAPVRPVPVQPASVRPAPAQPPPVQPSARPPTPAQPLSRTPVAPLPGPAPRAAVAPDQPAPRLPTTETVPRPRPQPTVQRRVAQPGDRICGSCGEPNDPSRRFCRRCGSNIQAASVVPTAGVPWYRRLFRREPTRYEAGERRASMRPGGSSGRPSGIQVAYVLRWALSILVGLGVVSYAVVPGVQGLVNGFVTDTFEQARRIVAPRLVIERPVAIEATDERPDHGAELLFDRAPGSHWEAAGDAPAVTVVFDEPIELGAIIVYNGAAQGFVDLRRASVLEVVFPDGTSRRLTLEDVHEAQTLDLAGPATDRVTVRVADTDGPADAPVAISELEFFAKR